jgi:MFS family permease
MAITAPAVELSPGWFKRSFVTRQLPHFPAPSARLFYLGIVVLTTMTLYYLYYVEGAVTPLMLPYYHMSFLYFLYLLVVSNAVGAFTAFIGGLSDKIGRANLTIGGTFIVGMIQLVGVPNIHSKFGFAVAYTAIGFVEGIILVSTPALTRDFSPQLGRASAMGFWALGPVVGSLAASLVATHTLPHLGPWQDQFVISGLVCMVVVVIAFFGLRELAPALRDQLLVSTKEQALLEARAAGIDVEAATRHPARNMLKLDLIASSLGVSVFLLIYYASVSVLTIFWVAIFNRTASQANGINTWYWAADAVTLVVVGVVSDRLRVRKPFMVLGAVGTIIATFLLIRQTGHSTTGYYGNVVLVVFLGIAIGLAYTPWMAGYTEAVEARNPALSATGLAIWGWILRIVVALSFLVLPHVITTSTTLVDHYAAGTELQALQAANPYVPVLGSSKVPPPAPASVLAELRAVGTPAPTALAAVLESYDRTHNLLAAVAAVPKPLAPQVPMLLAFQPLALDLLDGKTVTDAQIAKVGPPGADLVMLLQAARTVIPAQSQAPAQWKRWWWVCLVGQVVFLLLIFSMRGPWTPARARREIEEREAKIEREAKLETASSGA